MALELFAKTDCLCSVLWLYLRSFFSYPGICHLYCTLLVHTSKRTQNSMERGPEERMSELSYLVCQYCSLPEGVSCLQNGHNTFLLQEIKAVFWAVRIHSPFGKFHVGFIPTNSFHIHYSVFFSFIVSCQV